MAIHRTYLPSRPGCSRSKRDIAATVLAAPMYLPNGSRDRGRWLLTILALPLLLLTFLLSTAHGQTQSKRAFPPRYQIIELPLRPSSISNSGWVAGTTSDERAATWNLKTGLYRIPLPDGFSYSECASINSSGQAAGTALTADSSRRVAFILWQRKVLLLSGEQSRANSINESGAVVGQAILHGGVAGPVLWKNGGTIDLNICCAGSARSINGQGLVVGDTYDHEGHYHVFLWDAARGAHLLPILEEYSSALALNSRGVILLRATPGDLFLYSGGRLEAIDIPKSTPRALNKDGIVVGSVGPSPAEQRAFVWDKAHGTENLNTLIPPNSGWKLEVASGVNDRGDIVGWGDHNGVQNAGFLLRLSGRRKRPVSAASPKHLY